MEKSIEMPRATLSVVTTEGYSVLVTITEAMTNKEMVDLMDRVKFASTKAKEAGFIPKTDGRSTFIQKPATSQTGSKFTHSNTPPSTIADEPATKVCPVHEVTMYKKNGRNGVFYSHYDQEHGYCSGRGFKDEKSY